MRPRASHVKLMCIVLLLALTSTGWTFRNVSEGMDVPEIEALSFSGESVSLHAALDDGPLIFLFWASWSQRSLQQMEDIQALLHDPRYRELQFLAVNVEAQTLSQDQRNLIVETVRPLAPEERLLWDEGLKIFHQYGVISVPSSLLIDKDHSILATLNGYSPAGKDRFRQRIDELLGLTTVITENTSKTSGYRPNRDASLHNQLGHQLLDRNFPGRAIDEFLQALALDSLFIQNRIDLAQAYRAEDEMELAEQQLATAITIAPENAMAHLRLAQLKRDTGELEAAKQWFAKALTLDDQLDPARLDLVRLNALAGDVDAAKNYLAQIEGLAPTDPRLLAAGAELALAEGDTARALDAFRQAIETKLNQQR